MEKKEKKKKILQIFPAFRFAEFNEIEFFLN